MNQHNTCAAIRKPISHLAMRIVIGLACVMCVSVSSSVEGQDDKKSALGERQRLVERKMMELETTFANIALRLKEKDPKRAKRLIDAYQQAKERLITKNMADVGRLLDQQRYPEAVVLLDEVIGNVQELVKLLLNQADPEVSKKKEMEMLEEWKKNLQDIRQEQNQQRRETDKVANKEQTVKRLEQQIKQLEGLIASQQALTEDAKQSEGAGIRRFDKIADQQFEIRRKTEALAKELAKDPTAKIGKPPGESRPADPSQRNKDSKPGEGDAKVQSAKSGEGKPGEGKPGEGKPGENTLQSPAGQPRADQSPTSESDQLPQPGQKPLQKAAGHQRRAEEKIGSGKAKDAQRQAAQAKTEMENALRELEKEKRRIESLPPEAFEQMAAKQRRTRDKAMDVVKRMEKAPKQKTEEGAEQGGENGAPKQQQPGQDSMQQAAQKMQEASKSLDEQNPDEAQKKQNEAEQAVKKALEEIEERLNQLREETQEEKLDRLEARFKEMLERQRVASVMTIEMDDKKSSLGQLPRRDQLVMLRLATEESDISELGSQAYDLLLEDGTAVAFPEIVQDLQDDLSEVSVMLQNEQTGQMTQLVQKEIEGTLEQLLDALKEIKKKGGGGGGGGGGSGKKQPLLKRSEELKLIRGQQRRLNRRTRGIDGLRQDSEELSAEYQKALEDLAERQTKLLEMAEGIMEQEQDQ